MNTTSKWADVSTKTVNTLPFEQLQPGWHPVVVKMAIETNDFMSGLRNPVMKPTDQLPPWKDPTYQLAFYFEGENHKGATRRFSRYGYCKFDEMVKTSPETAKEFQPMGEQRYAIDKVDLVRCIDDELTNKCMLILDRCTTAAGIPEDTPKDKLCELMIGRKLQIEIGRREYNGKIYMDVINFASLDTPAVELARIPKPENILSELPATAGPEAVVAK
jgi:hypothetical protein